MRRARVGNGAGGRRDGRRPRRARSGAVSLGAASPRVRGARPRRRRIAPMSGTRATGSSDPLESLQWLLGKSWRLGRLFGIEIRIYWTVILVFGIGVYEFTKWSGVGFLTAALLSAGATAGLYVIVLTHEFGHALAGRRYRVRTPTITMSALGGLAHMSNAPPGPKADIVISLAGPATHALWLGVGWALGRVVPIVRVGEYGLPIDVMDWIVWLNVRLAIFNLLPFFPMDGGNALRGLLALRWHPNLASLWSARVGALGAVGFVLWGLHQGEFGGGLLLAIGLTNFFACTREMSAARWSEGPYREVGDSWELDPEGWKTGSWR